MERIGEGANAMACLQQARGNVFSGVTEGAGDDVES